MRITLFPGSINQLGSLLGHLHDDQVGHDRFML